MRSTTLAVGALALLALPGSALADDASGGVAAPSSPSSSAAPAPAPVSAAAAGGASFRVVAEHPVARLRVPAKVRAGARPRIRVRFVQRGIRRVVARVVVLRIPSNDPVARIVLGRVRTGRTLRVSWPRDVSLAAGQYVVRVHAHDRRGHQLKRLAHASGKATMTVAAAPAPDPVPAAPVPSSKGVFPVNGAWSFGEGFGTPRPSWSHQGQDILGAEGTPVVAPLGGTIASVSYQASAAGEYVVLNASDGHAYFFAHCVRHSTVVSAGQTVAAGAPLCKLGQTGDATGPHLHFEEWVNGWRTSSASAPVDPLPQLKAWAGRS